MPYVLFVLIAVIWGASFILMKKAALSFTPVTIGAWRLIGGAAVLGLAWWLTRVRPGWRKADAWPLVFVALIGNAFPYALQPYLVASHGSAFIGMTISFVPVLTILVSVPLLGVYPSKRQLAGVAGALVCMAALMADGLQRRVPPADLLLAATVPLGYALANIIVRRHLRHVPSLALSFTSLALAAAGLLPLAWSLPGENVSANESLGLAIGCLAILGVVGTGLAMVMFNRLIQNQGPLFAGMVTYLVPIGAVIWGWLDREPVSLVQLAALAGILVMVALAQSGAARAASGEANIEDGVPKATPL
ncbi:MAG: DMT family transporter [Pirellulales bacterium]